MNNNELQAELNINKSDKELTKAQLEANLKQWADYALKNKEDICSYQKTVVVKKKTSAKWKEFKEKLKSIFGLNPKKKEYDGIEAYLQYRDDFE